MDKLLYEKSVEYCRHLHALSGLDMHIVETGDKGAVAFSPPERNFCTGCAYCECGGRVRMLQYGCSEANRWDGRFIFYCPIGLTFIASPLKDDRGIVVGGIAAGPLLLGDMIDMLSALPDQSMSDAVSGMSAWTSKNVTHFSALMSASAAYISSALSDTPQLPHRLSEREIGAGREMQPGRELILIEKELQRAILAQDKQYAGQLINTILISAYNAGANNIAVIKTRVVEMLVIMSRAAIDAGTDSQEMLSHNHEYISQIEQAATMDEIDLKLSAVIHSYIRLIFDYRRARYTNTVYRILKFLKTHYQEKLTLDDIAGEVYLSRSYLSSLFKEQTGEGIFSCLNRIRVENSKLLLYNESLSLAEVAAACGFVDQSYYNKVFRKVTGQSPSTYRASLLTYGEPDAEQDRE